MTTAIAIIKDEHRSIAAVLKGLQAHLRDAKAGRQQPDFHLFQAMLDYIEAFPERIHHPKEDQFLFRLLRLRHVEAGDILDELEAQHVSGRQALAALREALEEARASGDVAPFEQALEGYAESQWAHMSKEEEVVLPLAERYLTEEDWQTIDIAFEANRSRNW
jgi:hemerythrin-like domain-containing protein